MIKKSKESYFDYKKADSANGIKTVTQADIDDALIYSSSLKRARMPIHIHESFDEVPQRFINCLNPGTYVRPHMHISPNHWELKSWLSGELIVLLFDSQGKVISKILMNDAGTKIVEIPPFCYHTVVAVKKGAYLEIRNGKYQPPNDKVCATWSPEENSAPAKSYQESFLTAQIGDLLIL